MIYHLENKPNNIFVKNKKLKFNKVEIASVTDYSTNNWFWDDEKKECRVIVPHENTTILIRK